MANCIVNQNQLLPDGRRIGMFYASGGVARYDPTKTLAVILAQDGTVICTSDSRYLAQQICSDWNTVDTCTSNYIQPSYPNSGNSGSSSGDSSGGLQGFLDSITKLIATLNNVFSGGLTDALITAAKGLQDLPTTLGSIISEISGSNTDILNQLAESSTSQLALLSALNESVKGDLVTALNDQTYQIKAGDERIAQAFQDTGKQIGDDYKTATLILIDSNVEQNTLLRTTIKESVSELKDAETAAGNKIALAIAALGVAHGVMLAEFETYLTGVIATMNGSLAAITGSINAETTGINLNILKVIAVVGAALAIPQLVDFDAMKGLFAGIMTWIAEQQIDVSRMMYEKIKQKGGVSH